MFVKKNVGMDFAVVAMGLVYAALLAGCAGFTEDTNTADRESAGNSELGELIAKKYAAARTTETGKMSVDETVDSVTLVFETFGGCIKNENSLSYNFDYYHADSHTFAYSFRGDTLLLTYRYIPDPYEVDQEEYDESLVLVGGLSGTLDGVWFLTQCAYREDRMYCYNDGYDTYLKLDGNKVEVRVADRENYDYMQTVFVDQLFDFLGNGGSVQLETPYYYSSTEFGQERSGIVILEKTNTTMKFTHADLTFDLSIDYARYGDSLHVTLKSGDVSCVGTVREMDDVLPEVCSADNEAYLWKSDSGAYTYERKNSREFETCIDGILGRTREW